MQYPPWMLQSGFVEQWMLTAHEFHTLQTTGKYRAAQLRSYPNGDSLWLCFFTTSYKVMGMWLSIIWEVVSWWIDSSCMHVHAASAIHRLPQPCIEHASLFQCKWFNWFFFCMCFCFYPHTHSSWFNSLPAGSSSDLWSLQLFMLYKWDVGKSMGESTTCTTVPFE